MEPEYQRELYRDVKGARYVGYEISVTSMGAALAVNIPQLMASHDGIFMELTCESEAKADQKTGTNEHANGLRSSLNGGSNAHDRRTHEHSSTTTNTVGHIGGKRITCERTNILPRMVSR